MRTAKKLGAAVGAVLVVLLLASCATPRDNGGPDPGLRGQWELQQGTDAGGEIALANQLISLTIAGDTTTAGRSTCSDYRAHVYGNVSTLWVTATLPRSEDCASQAQFAIEHRYIDVLNKVHTANLNGGILDLLAPGIDLRYSRALTVPTTLVVGHTWRLSTTQVDSYYGSENAPQATATEGTLRLGRDGSLTGTTGCHSFTARYGQNAGEIVVQHFELHTSGVCADVGTSIDGSLIDVIQAGFTFISESGALTISSPRAELTLDFVD